MKRTNIFCAFRMAGLFAGLLLLLFTTPTAQAAEASDPPLRVAFPPLPGICELDPYDQPTGLMVDYLNEIAKYTGWTYEYVMADSQTLTENFLNGQYDLMGGTYYSPDFEEMFAYPDYNIGHSSALLLCRKDDERLKSYDLTTMNGMTIGVYERATAKIQYLIEYLDRNHLDCELHYYTYDEIFVDGTLYDRLSSGEVDLIMGNELEIGGEFRMLTYFESQPYYIVTQPENTELLEELNQAMAHILESTPTFAEEVFQAHFPDLQVTDIQLNQQEQRYIAGAQTLTVAVPRVWHPLFCLNNSYDTHTGVIPEILEQISAFTGLSFTYVYTDTYAESIELVQRGEADLLGAYLGTAESAFADGLSLTRSYVTLNNIILKHKSVNYPADGLTCGLLNGRSAPIELGAAQVLYYDTASELLQALNRHEVDYIYGVSALLEQEMQNKRYMNVVLVSQSTDATSVSLGVPQPVTAELLTSLNKAICNIPSNVKTTMLNRNLISVGYSRFSLRDMIYDNPFSFIAILGGVLLVVMGIILLISRNRMRNAIMQSRLKAAEAKSVAKSEFLSRMSHEIRTPMNAIVGLTELICMENDLTPAVEEKMQKIRGSSRYLLALINDILDMSRIENDKMELEQKNFSLPAMLSGLEQMMEVQATQAQLRFQTHYRIHHDFLIGDPTRLRQIITNLLSNAIKFTPAGGSVDLHVEELSSDNNSARYRFSVVDTGIGIPPADQERIFSSFEQVAPGAAPRKGTGLGLPISRSIARLMGGDLLVKSQPDEGSEFYMTLSFPLGKVEALPPTDEISQPKPSLEGTYALLAEDNDLNAEIAQELLDLQGIRVDRATDGKQAVERFLQSAPGTYQVVLMDILMPQMDGYEATRQIRTSNHPDAGIPIIAMTANSFKEDEERARECGMTGFVSKPIDVDYLLKVLRDLLTE